MRGDIIVGSRWGGDRICPNAPDEGMSKTAKLDCESEEKQIRFWEQAKGLRDSRRFAVGFSHASTPSHLPSELDSHQHRVNPM